MNDLQLKIITSAVAIRVDNGESIEEALDRYSKLTKSERNQIKTSLADKVSSKSDEGAEQ